MRRHVTMLVALLAAAAAAAGVVGTLLLGGGKSTAGHTQAWVRHRAAAFTVEAPRGWRVARASSGAVTVSGDALEHVVIRPVFVGQRLDARSARVVAERLASRLRPHATWTPTRAKAGVVRLVARTQAATSMLLFTYTPTARGTAGYAFALSAPTSGFSGAAPTFARIAASFHAHGARVARSAAPRYKRWTDPAEGAFSVEIPASWKARGGTERPSTLLVQATVEAKSPDSAITTLMTDALPLYVEPNATLAHAGIDEGGTYTDPTGYSSPVRRYAPGAQFLRDYVLPQLDPGARIVHLKNRSDLAARLATYGINRYDAGEVEYTFTRNGVSYRGGGVAITEQINLPGYTAWHVWRLYLTEAPAVRYGEGVAALGRLAGSLRIDPAWAQRQSRTTAQQSRIVGEMSNDIGETLRSGYWGRQAVLDELSERRSKATLEVEDVSDPETGETYRVDSGPSYYWIDGDGQVVGTDTSTRPHVNFRELTRLDG